MSRKEKLLLRLTRKPPPRDFTWEELLTLLQYAGFYGSCNGGSHYVFEHLDSGLRLFLARPHPTGMLKRYQVEAALDALISVDAIKDFET